MLEILLREIQQLINPKWSANIFGLPQNGIIQVNLTVFGSWNMPFFNISYVDYHINIYIISSRITHIKNNQNVFMVDIRDPNFSSELIVNWMKNYVVDHKVGEQSFINTAMRYMKP